MVETLIDRHPTAFQYFVGVLLTLMALGPSGAAFFFAYEIANVPLKRTLQALAILFLIAGLAFDLIFWIEISRSGWPESVETR